MAYTVMRVAKLASVTVRALHHYDHIGLLKPESVSDAGYRLYTDADLERLQQVLFFRELGFSLDDIKSIVSNPKFDRRQALLDHKRLLLERRHRLDTLIHSVERTIESLDRGVPMPKEAMFEGLDDSKMKEYKEEARRRWGGGKEYAESERRTSQYGKEDWEAIGGESNEINQSLAALIGRGPADPEVQHWIGRWFQLINDRFYTCTPEVFRGLGDGYVSDERFTAFYENIRPGLARFMRDAMHAYCDKLEAE